MDERTGYRPWLRAALAIALALTVASIAGCGGEEPDQTPSTQQTPDAEPAPEVTEPTMPEGIEDTTELRIEDISIGEGATAKAGDSVTVNYVGWLTDGTKFDSSFGGAPYTFQLGAGEVIAGWDEGVPGMNVGGRRLLVIPPNKGYGEQGAGGVIPPNATLAFIVDLVDVQ